MTEHKYVGQRLPRYDGMQHVTGKTQFVGDMRMHGMLYVKAWRSPVASATISRIDVSQAKALPGVVAVITHEQVPNNRYGFAGDFPVLADTEIRYKGQEVAAVAAETEEIARQAVELIKVDYKERPAVLDPFEAMRPDSAKVSPTGNFVMFDGKPYRPVIRGDVEAAFAQADHIIEGYFRTAAQEHCPIETQTSVVQTDSMGRTHIHTVTQAVFFNQGTLASILKKPQSMVHMLGGIVGGGFGAKNDPHTDHICAVLSLYTNGRPVRWIWTREEEFVASTQRGATHMFFKDAVTNDGHIIGRQVRSVRDGGAYVLTNDYVAAKHAFAVSGPYNIPNIRTHAYAVLTNRRPTSSMRGFGIYQASIGHELQIEHIAKQLGMDSWRIRFLNAVHDGDLSATQAVLKNCGLIESLQQTAERAGVKLDDEFLQLSSKAVREA
ncbi:MAG TPA: molybdopterin cofactor-binding domain-containing protein [Anaerolineales bacterium]|jgi:CO/xanthine dehydrogenase Mo-binding subunit